MVIYPREFVELQMSYPNDTVKINRLLSLEGRRDILEVHFRGKGYEILYPPYTFSNEDHYEWDDEKKMLKKDVGFFRTEVV